MTFWVLGELAVGEIDDVALLGGAESVCGSLDAVVTDVERLVPPGTAW